MASIPETQFRLFVVTNKTGAALGIYQTFEKAYQAISYFVHGRKLIEVSEDGDAVIYAACDKPNWRYRIESCLFTYDKAAPLVKTLQRKEYFSSLA